MAVTFATVLEAPNWQTDNDRAAVAASMSRKYGDVSRSETFSSDRPEYETNDDPSVRRESHDNPVKNSSTRAHGRRVQYPSSPWMSTPEVRGTAIEAEWMPREGIHSSDPDTPSSPPSFKPFLPGIATDDTRKAREDGSGMLNVWNDLRRVGAVRRKSFRLAPSSIASAVRPHYAHSRGPRYDWRPSETRRPFARVA